MDLSAFKEFVYIVLVNASQTASYEEAQVTHALLSNLNEFYKHMIKDDANVLLNEEIHALKHYVNIQKVRYGKRFDISIKEPADEDIYVGHFTIISFVDKTLNSLLNRYERFFLASVEFTDTEDAVLLEITVCIDGKKELSRKTFTKRGGRLCTDS